MHIKILIFLFLYSSTLAATDKSQKINKPQLSSITLSPHLTELVYSANAGDRLVGVSAYSDYPKDVLDKQVIGDAFHLNYELITQLDPDVIFYWQNGTPQQTINKLKNFGFRLVAIKIEQLSDIPIAINKIAKILNSTPNSITKTFNDEINRLKSQRKSNKTALIQISDQPIYTVNGQHWMSEAIKVCGLSNVYKDLKLQSAAVTLESVILKSPEVIVRVADLEDSNRLNEWQSIPAIKNKHIAILTADHFTRPTLRILLAIQSLCDQSSSW